MTNPEATRIIQSGWQNNSEACGGAQGALVDFCKNCQNLHADLRKWHCSNFTDIEKQLTTCNNTVLFFDQIEEHRLLTGYERRFRIMIRERAYHLSTIIESRWQHRSRCRWLRVGDKNTKFFHAYASARHRRNKVYSLLVNDHLLTEDAPIREAFKTQMEALLGVESEVLRFKTEVLYPANLDLSSLQEPFTDLEIQAVKQLARLKASGPDGVINEFLQVHWQVIKLDVIRIIQGFYSHDIDLISFNQANITMIPKKEEPKEVGDYRPISVMNVIPKLISKLLANRLRGYLPNLISPTQTAFIHGRQISENFNSTREILHHISKNGKSTCFIKLDFAKAFDSVNWDFLRMVMQARGFPTKWIKWIDMLFSTASSKIVVNGGETEYFKHCRGLRQVLLVQ